MVSAAGSSAAEADDTASRSITGPNASASDVSAFGAGISAGTDLSVAELF